jgi:hypothetical protein
MRFSLTTILLGALACLSFGAGELHAQDNALERPDITMWPTLGTTVRVQAGDGVTPWQMRHVQMEPGAYVELLRSGRYPDGAMLSADLHGVALDTAHTPPLYAAGEEVALVLEVIDRAHPDGRRFYAFTPGMRNATALPPGNECAVCHSAQGSFDGTFAHLYPATSHLAQRP